MRDKKNYEPDNIPYQAVKGVGLNEKAKCKEMYIKENTKTRRKMDENVNLSSEPTWSTLKGEKKSRVVIIQHHHPLYD